MIPFVTFDTETRGLFGKIFLWKAYDGETITKGYSGDEASAYLMGLPEGTHIYIHNLEFDLGKLLKSGILLDLQQSRVINRAFAVATLKTGQVLHCSWHIMRSSLKSLSKSFALGGKGKMDLEEALIGYTDAKGRRYEKKDRRGKIVADLDSFFRHIPADDPLVDEYSDYDVISLHNIISQVIEFSGLDLDFYKIVTTPQLSMQIFKKNFKPDYDRLSKENHHNERQEYFFRQAYVGAHTEVYRPELKPINEDCPCGYHYDVNSLYPYVMENFQYPIGFFTDVEGPEAISRWEMVQRKPDKYKAAIVACTIEIPKKEKYPCLPVKIEGKLIFPNGKITGTWTLPEIRYALSRGAKMISVSRIAYWKETADYFREFITWAKEGKLNSKGGKRQLFKDIMNSFYGKLGMNLIRENYLPDTPENRAEFLKEAGIHDYWIEDVGNFLEGWVKVKKFTVPYVQPHIAAYVTAYARIELMKALHRETDMGNSVYYCDTDSLVLEYPMEEEYIHESEFGKWKEENQLSHGIFLEPKLYAEKPYYVFDPKVEPPKETIKGKGIPRNVLDTMDFSFYEKALEKIRNGAEEIKIFEGELRRRKIISSWKASKDLDEAVVDSKNINFRLRQKRNMDWVGNDSKPWDYKLFLEEQISKERKLLEMSQKHEERDTWISAHNGAPSLAWVIKKMGGIKSSARQMWEDIPAFLTRKNGLGLDEFAGHSQLSEFGFYFSDTDEFYEAVKNWRKYSCP